MRLTCQSIVPSSLVVSSNLRSKLNAISGETPFDGETGNGYSGGNGNGNLHVEDFTLSSEDLPGEGITHAMNEVILHRGRSPHLTMLDISIDGVYLTEAIVLPPLPSKSSLPLDPSSPIPCPTPPRLASSATLLIPVFWN